MFSKFNKKQYSNKMFKAREIDGEVLIFGNDELKKKDDSSSRGEVISNKKKTMKPEESLTFIGKK